MVDDSGPKRGCVFDTDKWRGYGATPLDVIGGEYRGTGMTAVGPRHRGLFDFQAADGLRRAARLDIVFPAYNEELRIDRTLDSYRNAISHPSVRFVVALDGGDDASAEIVRRHADADPRVGLLEFPKLGKGGVLMEAFRRCDGDLIGFVDADRATSPGELLRLAAAARFADGAIATRRHPSSVVPARRSTLRRVCSAGFVAGMKMMFGLPFSDTQCGAKVFKKEVVQSALPFLSARDFLFDVDLLLVACALGYRVVEVPTIWIDQDGSRVRPVVDTGKMTASAMRLWLHHKVLPVCRSTSHEPAGRSRDLPVKQSG